MDNFKIRQRSRIAYKNFEKINVDRPVDRLDFIANFCKGKNVLDLGCLDETSLIKQNTRHWLHGRISETAKQVVGIDNSLRIPSDAEIITGKNSRIIRQDALDVDYSRIGMNHIDALVAGELIEHLEDATSFLTRIKAKLPGIEFILSTPNGCSISNFMMGLIGRESQHPDHTCNFTYKTLNTLCLRANLEQWEIVPYKFYATEMKLKTDRKYNKALISLVEKIFRALEFMFPLTSFGYIVKGRF
ncbi:hypothetical protein SAMN05428989_2328 [Pseudoxanthomonas sp. GM95]|uniref:class I SAM-dependent methyltransferase n=1 Tax=Pseudoxanthomonas sp. GM95 TaxID=1881043 RepID=UPI0008ACE54A|nr:methyltransferase domain-containing protein [Pseudoxanthomonas sp. GM95]SEL71889.1 hypothetical protein SAMN05428989_2328 [Pseudoxanthomonas sp. GM95]